MGDLCCLTSSQKIWLTCEEASMSRCSTPWKYLGNQKCCTTDYTHCEEGTDAIRCKRNGWQALGSSKCCTTSSHQLHITCQRGWLSENCMYHNGKYLGNGKCCWD